MADAIERGLEAGAARVCILGSDSPLLPREHLRRAIATLDQVEVVIGPAEDGGYWLIGARRAVPSLFTGMAWGTPAVLATTQARLDALAISYALADPFWDVDEPTDLERLRRALRADPTAACAPATRAALAAPIGG
jgi:glycosyltransferase A (GT-A) superfamily protein (DUF2064 family)